MSGILDKFNNTSTEYLNNLYESVESDFSKFYRILNDDDEKSFKADMIAEKGSVGLDVDFYGRGKFPPLAYHSEGHQDGMGICLYLALMKRTLIDDFTLCVLDDVLTSIDEGHKKSFIQLLKKEFPDTQFIVTTHDKYWLQQMIQESFATHKTTLKFKKLEC